MPLVRNMPLEDPKALLDAVAVAGFVGILRQLGDLSEFAAEVFHGIQEQVLITSSRSHKLGERIYNIEVALPRLEKAILMQKTHLHFAYTSGLRWHSRPRTEQNHFVYSDLPRCIMDSYEDCYDPPCLHKLDKFDTGGKGSCFKRYSDPTYFKGALSGPYAIHLQSVPTEKKARRSKKKRSLWRHRDMTRDAPIFTHGSGMDFAFGNSNEKTSPSLDVSTIHFEPKSEMEDHLTLFDSRNGSGYIECIFSPSYSKQSEENEAKEPSSDLKGQQNAYLDKSSVHENNGISDENGETSNLHENNGQRSSFVTWDEKLEIVESTEIARTTEKLDTEEHRDLSSRVDLIDFDFDFHDEYLAISVVVGGQPDEMEREMDYSFNELNIVESESETDARCHTKNIYCSPKPNQISHESHIEAHSFSNNDTCVDEPNSHLSEIRDQATLPQIVGTSLISSICADDFKPGKRETHDTNLVTHNSREANLEPPSSDHESPEPPSSTSGVQTSVTNPVMFWTNGGLLGLAPSKPPDSGLTTTVRPDSGAQINDDIIQDSSQKNAMEDMERKASNSTMPAIKENGLGSSGIFELSNRLLVNGFRRQISLVGVEKLSSSMTSHVPKKPNTRTAIGKPFEEQFGSGSPSSPPLQHMTISFQPIDAFETCKLNLKLPDESNIGLFPSFELVPEPCIWLHESGSGSGSDSDDDDDDDTFCRSSPYHSESNSEQWDSGDSPKTNNHELVDASGRISSAESVSSSYCNDVLQSLNLRCTSTSGR